MVTAVAEEDAEDDDEEEDGSADGNAGDDGCVEDRWGWRWGEGVFQGEERGGHYEEAGCYCGRVGGVVWDQGNGGSCDARGQAGETGGEDGPAA